MASSSDRQQQGQVDQRDAPECLGVDITRSAEKPRGQGQVSQSHRQGNGDVRPADHQR